MLTYDSYDMSHIVPFNYLFLWLIFNIGGDHFGCDKSHIGIALTLVAGTGAAFLTVLHTWTFSDFFFEKMTKSRNSRPGYENHQKKASISADLSLMLASYFVH